jgi:Ribbon-helix-helix protein, copG family
MTINVLPKEKKVIAFIGRTRPHPQGVDSLASKTVVNLRMDREVLARVDADAKRLGISRTAWLHVAAHEKLKRERE